MKSKRGLILSILQVVIGLLAIIAFAVVCTSGENISKWAITLVLAIAYVVMGIIGIVDYIKK